ncbi:MAG: ABC transporter permease subunit [Actinobacteria bacterium]|nr:ABC transporter permease subunit [Actinomycetota bacterium]
MTDLFSPANWEWITSGNNLRFLFEGFFINLQIAVVAMMFSLIFGLLLALANLSKTRAVSVIARMWVDVWRNLPLIFVLLFFALALPGEWYSAWEDNVPAFLPRAYQNGRILAAIAGLVFYNSAVMCEIMRAGILSLERGQGDAAASLGMRYWQSMRLVVLPQGLRRMVPATVSQLITLNKDTTLVSIIGIREIVRHAKTVTNANPFTADFVKGPPLQVYLAIGIMFIIVNFALSRLAARLEERERKPAEIMVTGLEDQVA